MFLGRVAGAMALMLAGSLFLTGQTQSASVRGVIKDATGATVPGASVQLTNTQQNRSWRAETNEQGIYVLLQTPPGPLRHDCRGEGV